MRIPLASFCQRSTTSLSSSSAALKYMEKNRPESLPKLDACDAFNACDICDGCDGAIPDSVLTESGRHLFYICLWTFFSPSRCRCQGFGVLKKALNMRCDVMRTTKLTLESCL